MLISHCLVQLASLDVTSTTDSVLAVRKELARRSHTMSEEWRSKIDAAKESLLQHQEDQRAVSAGMLNDFNTKIILSGFLWDRRANILRLMYLCRMRSYEPKIYGRLFLRKLDDYLTKSCSENTSSTSINIFQWLSTFYLSTDMTRQYKTMQTEMSLRIHQLEVELERTNRKLGTFAI